MSGWLGVLFRYHQSVTLVGRIDIHEGQRVSVFMNLEAGNFAGNDLAENAILLCAHQGLFSIRAAFFVYRTLAASLESSGNSSATVSGANPPGA